MLYAIIIFLSIILLYFLIWGFTVPIRGNCGKVFMTKAQRSSDIFCRLHSDIEKIMNSLPINDPRTIIMKKEYSHTDLVESNSTHTIAKGFKIYVDVNYSLPELRYMVLHELAHMITKKYGHGTEFWKNFKWLISIADMLSINTKVV